MRLGLLLISMLALLPATVSHAQSLSFVPVSGPATRGTYPYGIASGDLDGDGHADLGAATTLSHGKGQLPPLTPTQVDLLLRKANAIRASLGR